MALHELRIPFRHLLKSPGFTTAAVLMLALGIGATTAIFSIVEGVLLQPLPFPHPERLVELSDVLQGGNDEAGVTAPGIRAYVRDTHSFDALGGYQRVDYELSGTGEPARVRAARMSAAVFPTLGVAPLLGRVFTQQEDDQREQVAVISDTLWRNRLHSDAQVLGTKIFLNRKPYTVIGVMPREFVGSHELHCGGTHNWSGILELRDGGTAEGENHRGGGRERCGAGCPGDHAQLSCFYVQHAYSGSGTRPPRADR